LKLFFFLKVDLTNYGVKIQSTGFFLSRSQSMGSFFSTAKSITQDHHCPTPDDVFAVRNFLLAFVPAELANLILNQANYWPKATLSFEPEYPLEVDANDDPSINASSCCLVTPKLCDLLCDGKAEPYYKIKTIRFEIVSHDQGWCSDNYPGMIY
jgi:hypothetical protein